MWIKILGWQLSRGLLWLSVGLVLVRGVITFLPASEQGQATATVLPLPPPAPVESDAARSLAALFATEYLSWRASDLAERSERLRGLMSADMESNAGLSGPVAPGEQRVISAHIWSLQKLSGTRAIITVLMDVITAAGATGGEGAPPSLRRVALAVPIAYQDGAYAVYDYPAFVALPDTAPVVSSEAAGEPAPEHEGAVRTLVENFLKAYAAGAAGEISYFAVPGATFRSLRGEFRFVGVEKVAVSRQDSAHWAAVVAVMEDPTSGARFRQRYILQVEQRERWYVSGLQQQGGVL